MRLHHRGNRADWEKVRATRRTRWQRLAKSTHGILTPANFITLLGFIVVALGCYLLIRHEFLYGILAIIVGRLADIIDGIVAERTKTKSSLGEIMDATTDKLAMLLLLIALISQHLIPIVILGLVLVQNGLNVVLALLSKAKKIELQPSATGKITVATTWMSLVMFAAATVAGREGRLPLHASFLVAGLGLALLFIIFGFLSTKEYLRLVVDSLKYNPKRDLFRELSRIIIVVNPQSTNVHRIEKRGNELHKLFPDKTIALVETSFDTSELAAKLKKEIAKQPGLTLICIGGGDGTVHAVINALMRLATEINLAKTPILPLWGGNANDLAYMLNGLSSRNTLKSVLGRGNIIAIRPFEITTESNQQVKKVIYAACYASFGASAYATAELEKPEARNKKIQAKSTLLMILNELGRVLRAILEAPGFDAEQEGEKIKIFDQVFANGSRMGKIDHLPVKLNEKKFYRAVKSEKQPTFWFYMLWLLRSGHYGEVTSKNFRFTTKQRAWAQFDGEASVLAKNTTVEVGHSQTSFYAVSTKLSEVRSARQPHKRTFLRIFSWFALLVLVTHAWLYVTDPYGRLSLVQSPYTTRVSHGQIVLSKNYDMRVYTGPVARALGYYKSGFLIVLNNLAPSHLTDKDSVAEVIDHIHALRFDPAKPYLISGNQYSVLYPRNLGVFYNSLLDPHTARSTTDWEHYQQIYLQSTMYALDAFSTGHNLATTIVPISQRGVLLTEVHPGSIPSDSLYGLLYAFRQLSGPVNYSNSSYKLQTVIATRDILWRRRADLQLLLNQYVRSVQDPETGLIRRHLALSGARDGVVRDSSFYDNVVLWKTLTLANELGIRHYDQNYLDNLRTDIISHYWDKSNGIFSDEYPDSSHAARFSADWLITLPTGFLNPVNPADRAQLASIVDYTEREGLSTPFPIKYALPGTDVKRPPIVRWLIPDYGGNIIWSYWGTEYITLLDRLQPYAADDHYTELAARDLTAYDRLIRHYGAFPETYKPNGTFLQTAFYKSILQTGWIVQFEQALYEYRQPSDILRP